MRMPQLGHLPGRLDRLAVECWKCPRKGSYSVMRLIRQHGRHKVIADWLAEVSATCPQRQPEHLQFHSTDVAARTAPT